MATSHNCSLITVCVWNALSQYVQIGRSTSRADTNTTNRCNVLCILYITSDRGIDLYYMIMQTIILTQV